VNLAEYIEGRKEAHLEELKELLRIPSVSAKREHKPDIEQAAKWVADKLRASGMKTVEIAPTNLHPLVYAESLEAPGKPTILFYGHYDVQPPEPLELWTSPAFEPAVRNGNLFGRGTADDKGQVHIHLKALESLRAVNGKLPVNVKVLIEGEEEVGSVSLWDYVKNNKAKLKADALVVSDTSMLGRGVPSITYGLRGLNYYQIEITGPSKDLHSGVYGGAVPNPLTVLCELFAKMHDKNFRVTVPGFYDDVRKLSAAERKALNALPWKAKDFKQTVGAPGYCGEKGFSVVERLWTLPGRSRKDSDTVKGLREVFNASGSGPGPRKNCEARRKARAHAVAQDRKLQVRSAEHGQALGRPVSCADLQEGNRRFGERFRQEGRVHSRRRVHPVRHADVRHV